MTDLEQQLRSDLDEAARSLSVEAPPLDVLRSGIDRRQRAHTTRRAVIGVTAVAAGILGLVVLTNRPVPTTAPLADTVAPDTEAARTPSPTLALDSADSRRDSWSRLPDNRLGARSQHLVVAAGNGLFVWGGYLDRALSDGAFYDADAGTWRALPAAPLAADRGDAVGVWTGREVIVVNGGGLDSSPQAAAFDPAAFTWRQLGNPPVTVAANALASATVVDGEVFLLSVWEDNAPAVVEAALLDVAEGTWTAAPAPPLSFSSGAAVVTAGSEVIVVGEQPQERSCTQLQVMAYTPATSSWRELPNESVVDINSPVVAWTGTELFIGGASYCRDALASEKPYAVKAALLDLATSTWRPTSAPPMEFYGSYRSPDPWTGTAVGTIAPTGEPLLYRPDTDTWHVGPALPLADQFAVNHTPIVALGGALIISGGALAPGGGLCCEFAGTYRYMPPTGW